VAIDQWDAEGEDTSLEVVARRFKSGEAVSEELTLSFAIASLYCRRDESPGFLAVGAPGKGLVPMYSSREKLFASEGECLYFRGHGYYLAGLIPTGYGILLDLGCDSELVLESWALKDVGNVVSMGDVGVRP